MNSIHNQHACLRFIFAVLLVMLLGVPLFAQDAVVPKITEILVQGNKNINSSAIIATSGLNVGDVVSQATLDAAKQRLIRTGNYGAHHPDTPDEAVKLRAETDNAQAKVIIEVDENDLIQGINLTGTGPIPASDIKALLKTREGQVLNVNTLRTDVVAIQAAYDAKGYQAFVSDALGITNGILDIPVIVGKISKLKINGMHKTKPWVVYREMKLKSGDYYNVIQLRKDLTSIFNTDLFDNVEPAFAYPTPGQVEITLNIQEKRTGTMALGLGYSSRQKLFVFADVGESNFLGRGQQVNLHAETGGIANRNSFELGFTEPWLDRKHTSLTVDVFDKAVYRFGSSVSSITSGTVVGTNKDYYETHTGAKATLSRPFGENLRGYMGIRFDNVRVPALDLNANDAAILQNGPLATLTLSATHNTRDYDQEPAAGGLETLSMDIGHADLRPVKTVAGGTTPGIFGILDYTKISTDARHYFSPKGRRKNRNDKRQVFAVRMMLGTSTGRLPFSEQYFVGGSESLRGYQEDRFWGRNMFLGSFEFRQPIANALTGVIFVDAGDAWGGSYENVAFNGFTQHAGFSPSIGLGIGLRVVTPLGPIRIDEGFGREGARTHFSIGHAF